MTRGSTGDHRDEPGTTGAPTGNIKMFNTSRMNREGTETTGTAPGTTGTAPGRHRSSTVAHTDPDRATATPRLSPLVPRWNPGECRHNPNITTVHWKTGVLPGRHRHSPGLRLGITDDDRDKTGALPYLCWGMMPVEPR
ncbi:hypothetical protein DPMN_118274 [Dreissena polymorpha]|uniref:Uncharacterized protein n=1 Tax=Dreissena polymorpha TaxID=45954 RepID=A0A9D4JQ33_DREPO|nr:hypothetical protein DPMN_118274 [Dreissena polymorpha]